MILSSRLEALDGRKTGHEVDRRARDVISDMGYGEYLVTA